MGLSDYQKNKGFSTDMYLRVKTPDGSVLDEVSLKKNLDMITTKYLNLCLRVEAISATQ